MKLDEAYEIEVEAWIKARGLAPGDKRVPVFYIMEDFKAWLGDRLPFVVKPLGVRLKRNFACVTKPRGNGVPGVRRCYCINIDLEEKAGEQV